MNTPKSVEIAGRRWFQKSYGNTYHTARVYVDGKLVGTVPYCYGYGSMFEQNALDLLERLGYMPDREHHKSGVKESGWRYFGDRNIPYTVHAEDVPRKRDL